MLAQKNPNDIIESSENMTKRSSAHISTLIIFLSILTIIVQYLAYYLIAPAFLILGISALICILCNHILIENSNTYYSSFHIQHYVFCKPSYNNTDLLRTRAVHIILYAYFVCHGGG